MYLSEVTVQRRMPRRRFISPYLGQAPAVTAPAIDTERAVRLNRRYAHLLGWKLAQVRRLLGFGAMPDEQRLANEVARWQQANGLPADGIIGPSTWQRMRAAVQPAASSVSSAAQNAVNTQLPTPGSGYYGYADNSRQYGRLEMIQAVQAIAAAWARRHPQRPRIGIGDISFQGGGTMPPHTSHRAGLDVDIRPMRNDGREIGVTYQVPEYSRTLTQEVVNLIHANGVLRVQFILFNDPEVAGVRPLQGHDNHLHIRFVPPN